MQAKRPMHIKRDYYREFIGFCSLGFGIACIGGAFYFFAPTLFTSEKELIERNGKVENVETVYSQVSSKGIKSVKSELIIKLHNDNSFYKIVENIGHERRNGEYESIARELKKSGKALVWIKESEQLNLQPKVFQIATGESKILYDMENVKSELKFLFPFLLIVGTIGIGLFAIFKYPNLLKK
jgi:predicted RND superfamily exporter protein